MGDRLRVDVDDGKYTVVMTQDGHLSALRYGEPWRDCVGDNLIGCMAHEIEELREKNADFLTACEAAEKAFDDVKFYPNGMTERQSDQLAAVLQIKAAITKAKS